MTELREKVKDWFIDMASGRHTYPKEGVPTAEELGYWRADQILNLIKEALPELAKEASYVRLAKDQSLPDYGDEDWEHILFGNTELQALLEAQQDMLTPQNGTVWRKVILEE